MTQQKKRFQPSPETREEAMKCAKATQKPGQTKEQTRLIAQGIQKGIEQYKKQHKIKSRALDKKRKKNAAHANTHGTEVPSAETIETVYKQHWLPWLLLVLSWGGVILFHLFKA